MLNVAFLALPAALLAGMAGLMVELSWLRAAGSRLPGTVSAAALVVPAFLLAWTVGSAWAGRLADRRDGAPSGAARWLAWAALAAWLLPALVEALAGRIEGRGTLTTLVVGGLPALPVAAALGGALPWLSRLRVRAGLSVSRATGGVAAATALGGALGCWRWTPWLLEQRDPAFLGALLLAVSAGLCWLLGLAEARGENGDTGDAAARASDDTADQTGTTTPADALPVGARPVLSLAALLAGAVLVSGQLAALRLMAQSEGDSIATTTTVLAVLHLGMAAGALLLAPAWAACSAGGLVAWLAAAGAVGVALATADTRGALLLAALVGLGAGSVVTAASRAVARRSGIGAWVGDLAALATFGGGLGGALHAWLVPTLGTGVLLQGQAAALGLVALAAGVVLVRSRGRLLGGLGLALALVAVGRVLSSPPLSMPWQTSADETTLLAQAEGPHGVVSLVGTADGGTRLKLDNRFGLGGSAGALLERRLGRLAASLAPAAGQALLLGVGRGQTLAGLAATTRAQVTAVERNAQILDLDLPVPFGPGRGPRGGPPTVLHEDARAWVDEHPRAYDLIVGDLFFPWVSGAGDVLGREQFDSVRRALSDEGVYVQWLPLHQLPWPAFGSVVMAFVEAFPRARLFVATPLAGQPLVALVGGLERGLPEAAAVDELLAGAPDPDGLNSIADVYDLHVADAWSLAMAFEEWPANRRAWPGSELLSLGRQGDEDWLIRTNTRLLSELVQPLTTSSLRVPPSDRKQRRYLDRELGARGEALAALLAARAALLELEDLPVAGADHEARERLDTQVDAALLAAWSVFPGHLGARTALIEWTTELTTRGLWGDAAGLLSAVLEIHGEARLAGLLGGLLVRLRHADEALPLLRQARAAAPGDLTVALHLGAALLHTGAADGEVAAALRDALELSRGALPPLHGTALALLEGRPGAESMAAAALTSIPADEPWALSLQRLLEGYRARS